MSELNHASTIDRNHKLFSALMAVLDEHPDAKSLSPKQKELICAEAIAGEYFHDRDWLDGKIIQAQKIDEIDQSAEEILGERKTQDSQTVQKEPSTYSKPMQPQSQTELETVIEKHSEWIKSVLHPKKNPESGRANLKGADLSGFNLDGADLRAANLSHTNLSNVSLIGARLSSANLQYANLESACLHKADLRRANLSHAHIQKADLREAKLDRATLEGVDLNEATINLSTDRTDESLADSNESMQAE